MAKEYLVIWRGYAICRSRNRLAPKMWWAMLNLRRHSALVALVAAGLLWGLTVPLSKLVLEWLDGGWVTVVRFAFAAPLLAVAGRQQPRRAPPPRLPLPGGAGDRGRVVLPEAGV